MLQQILAGALGLEIEDVSLVAATAGTPSDLGTWGGRATLMDGNAAIDAAEKLKARWTSAAPMHLDRHILRDLVTTDTSCERKLGCGAYPCAA